MYARIQDVTALIGRIALGVVFFAHGIDKWNAGIDATAQMFESSGIPLSTVAAVFVTAVEVIGPILFIAGFATPLVGIGFAIVGIGAMFFVHLEAGLTGEGGYELVLVLALTGLALGFNSGRLALDHLLAGRRRSSREAEPVS